MICRLLRWLDMMLAWLVLIPLTLLLYLLAWLPHPRWGHDWYVGLFHFWCRRWVDALGVNLRLHQANLKPLPAQYILIANHPSLFEDVGIPALFPIHNLAKAEVQDWWFAGRISQAAGTLFVKRESRDSRAQALQSMISALKEGVNIALYPEGGIKGKQLQDFHLGAFRASLQTGIPILPIYLHYQALDDFYWGDEHLLKKLIQIMASANPRVSYYQHDAIWPDQFTDAETYSNFVHDQYLAWQNKYHC